MLSEVHVFEQGDYIIYSHMHFTVTTREDFESKVSFLNCKLAGFFICPYLTLTMVPRITKIPTCLHS